MTANGLTLVSYLLIWHPVACNLLLIGSEVMIALPNLSQDPNPLCTGCLKNAPSLTKLNLTASCGGKCLN